MRKTFKNSTKRNAVAGNQPHRRFDLSDFQTVPEMMKYFIVKQIKIRIEDEKTNKKQGTKYIQSYKWHIKHGP